MGGLSGIEQGVSLFNQQAFFEAHEVWEEGWQEMEEGKDREVYQGFIQVAVGLVHAQRKNCHGMVTLLRKGLVRLKQLDMFYGVDVAQLRQDLDALLDVLPESWPEEGGKILFPSIHWVDTKHGS